MSSTASKFEQVREQPGRARASLAQLQKRWGMYVAIGPEKDPAVIKLTPMSGIEERWVRVAKDAYEKVEGE